VLIDISDYWPTGLSVNKAYEDSIRKNCRIDRRTLTAAREGKLAKCEVGTLIRLRDFAAQMSGKKLALEDVMRFEEEANEPD
jgi:hypothetical protein